MVEKKNVAINYTARDYESIKAELIEFAKRYYADTYKDFSDAGFGSMLVDLEAYIGDQLSFYLDYQANETFLDSMIEYNNVIRKGKELGYKFPGSYTTQGPCAFYVSVPAASTGYGPNLAYALTLKKGTQLMTPGGVAFILNEDVNFATVGNEQVPTTVSDTTGLPTTYAIKAYGDVISGQLRQEIINVTDYKKFRKIELDALDISEILSVTDSEGHDYYEVDYLSQNIVYREIPNRNAATNEQSPNILQAFLTPRRFVVERDRRKTYLIFGHGSETETTNQSIVDPAEVVMNLYGKDYSTDTSFDPSNLLATDKFGIAPANVQLRITYRQNSTNNANVSTNSITKITAPKVYFPLQENLALNTMNTVIASLEVSNEEPIVGNVSLPTTDEVKRRIMDTYAAQNRAVTEQDYRAVCYMMPAKYGTVKRVSIVRDSDSFKRNLNLYILCEDAFGNFVAANEQSKNNLKTWLLKYKMVSDTIDILDAMIINVGIDFQISSDGTKDRTTLLSNCVTALANEFAVKKNIGDSFFLTDAYDALRSVKGVREVISVEVVRKAGAGYATTAYDINANLSPDGKTLACPLNAVFEIKYPNRDCRGVIR